MKYMSKEISDYPMILSAAEVAEILQVSKPTAYQIMEQPGFPKIMIDSRCKRVTRDAFYKWLMRNE
jgi:predicted DNA-binding transcriptional regulator AlpA